MTRVRGGTRGLLAAFDAGIADPLSADEPRPRKLEVKERWSKKNLREIRRRMAQERALAERPPF